VNRLSLDHALRVGVTIASMSPRAEVIATTAGVEAFAPRWESLRGELEGTPFLGSVFYLGWLETLGSGFDPLLVTVTDDAGELIAVAPWARRGPLAISVSGRGGVAGELLVADHDAAEAWRVILAAVLRPGGLRAIVVPHIPDGPRGLGGARSAAAALARSRRSPPRVVRHRLQLRGTTFEEHLSAWSGKRRYSIRRSQRRLEARGPLSLHRLSGVEGYDTVRLLHLRQWTADQTIHQVHTAAGVALDQLLVGNIPSETLLLESQGLPLAAALWLDTGHLRVLQYLVRDPEETETSPGELVHFHVVRIAFEDDVRELDTMGAGGNKEHLGIPGEPAYELVIGRGAIGRAMLGARAAQLRVRNGVVMLRPSGRRRARAGGG
jgi:CelD/BcsL family acetyltransferase involved in cellulose biosynthesis